MVQRDLKLNCLVESLAPPQTPAGTENTAEIDMADADEVALILQFSAGTGSATCTIQDSDVSGSGYVNTGHAVTKTSFTGHIRMAIHAESVRRFIRVQSVTSGFFAYSASAVQYRKTGALVPTYDLVARAKP